MDAGHNREDTARPRRLFLDSCSWSRLAECPDAELVTRRILSSRFDVVVSLDVLIEVLCTPKRSRRFKLVQPMKRLMRRIVGAPPVAEVLTMMPSDEPGHPWGAYFTEVVKHNLGRGSLDSDLFAEATQTATHQRKREKEMNHEARDRFLERFEPQDANQSLEEALMVSARDRELLRTTKADLRAIARDGATVTEQRRAGILGASSFRCMAVGVMHLARAACLAPSKGKQRGLPNFTDLGYLSLMPWCGHFVTDDGQLRTAAEAAKSHVRGIEAEVGSFADLHRLLIDDQPG